MTDPARDRSPRPPGRLPRLSRRAALRTLAGGAVLLAAGCGGEDEDEPNVGSSPTEEAAAPPDATPTPTQEAIASPVPGYADPTKWEGRTLTVASLGGDYQDAQAAAMFEPFALATGVEVVQRQMDLGRLRDQVESGEVSWDVADVPTEEVIPLSRDGLLTQIDYQAVDKTTLFSEVCMQHGVGSAFFSTVIAYPLAAPRAPEGWADFWNTGAFGEGRALLHSPIGTLEFALLADGVKPFDLYPLDVERAFRGLDTIRPSIVEWYRNARQPVALVLNADAALASAWNVWVTTDGAGSVGIQWNGGMLSADSWVIPRGAPNADVAMDFINFATRAVPAANFARLVPFGPVNRDAFALLRPDRLPLLPTAEPQIYLQFFQGWNYWADHRAALTERFEEWLLAEPEGTPLPDA